MKISGFSMAKNAAKLYFPIKEAILSILPIVDEFVVALGDCDTDDETEKEILSIKSDKIKIIKTIWDIEKYPRGMEHAHQTDIACEYCTGDWLFYIQADEVVHEKDLPLIQKKCEEFLEDKNVEGFLFKYLHFWGDYDHYHVAHGWYKNEIRIVRNEKDIHSWESAQSFRRIPNFDGINYRQQEGTYKLHVVKLDAYIYHYGWVRPPKLMESKTKAMKITHAGKQKASEIFKNRQEYYDYGPLGKLKIFKGTHPEVMKSWIAKFNWKNQLNFSKKGKIHGRQKKKHEKTKYKIITFIEQNVLMGGELGGFKNFILLKGKKYR